jgi:hypothetical protein
MSGLLRSIGASAVKLANKLHPAEVASNTSGPGLGKIYLASKLRRVPVLAEQDISMLKSFRSSSQYTQGQAIYLGNLVFGSIAAFFVGEMIGRGMQSD